MGLGSVAQVSEGATGCDGIPGTSGQAAKTENLGGVKMYRGLDVTTQGLDRHVRLERALQDTPGELAADIRPA